MDRSPVQVQEGTNEYPQYNYRAIMTTTIVSDETPHPQKIEEELHHCAALLSMGDKAQINIGAYKSPRKFIAMHESMATRQLVE
jgi:hypothetical protein